MPFIRYKTVKGRKYYQLVRNYRDDGKHRQEVLCHLGPHDSIDAAIEAERQRIAPQLEYYEYYVSTASNYRRQVATLEELIADGYDDRGDIRRYNERAAWYDARAAKIVARLNRLLEVREKYF